MLLQRSPPHEPGQGTENGPVTAAPLCPFDSLSHPRGHHETDRLSYRHRKMSSGCISLTTHFSIHRSLWLCKILVPLCYFTSSVIKISPSPLHSQNICVLTLVCLGVHVCASPVRLGINRQIVVSVSHSITETNTLHCTVFVYHVQLPCCWPASVPHSMPVVSSAVSNVSHVQTILQ